jgi:putative phosphoribosyl transferase
MTQLMRINPQSVERSTGRPPREVDMHETIPVAIPPHSLSGDLIVPDGHHTVIVFALGEGFSRHSPSARAIAEALADAGFGVLLLDPAAGKTGLCAGSADIDRLAEGLVDALDWVRSQPRYRGVHLGLLGTGVGSAAALQAAARRPAHVSSIVSYGGSPDRAGEWLTQVKPPTLLIVGGVQDASLESNRQALQALRAPARISVIPGATDSFAEPGAMDAATARAISWFSAH